jgi:hypothetical protein
MTLLLRTSTAWALGLMLWLQTGAPPPDDSAHRLVAAAIERT